MRIINKDMGLANNRFQGIIATVLADASIRVKVEEGTPNAVLRDFEDSKGNKGQKWELVYTEIFGIITKIEFRDSDYGKNLNVTLTDKGEDIILSLSTAINFGEDLMKKLPNIDLSKEVKLVPYALTDKNNKDKKGITVYQGGNKIKNYFSTDELKPKVCNGYPDAGDNTSTFDKEDWKVYFIQCRKFLVKFIEDNIIPMVDSSPKQSSEPMSAVAVMNAIGGQDVTPTVITPGTINVPNIPFN